MYKYSRVPLLKVNWNKVNTKVYVDRSRVRCAIYSRDTVTRICRVPQLTRDNILTFATLYRGDCHHYQRTLRGFQAYSMESRVKTNTLRHLVHLHHGLRDRRGIVREARP
jgi:hypothetical protein